MLTNGGHTDLIGLLGQGAEDKFSVAAGLAIGYLKLEVEDGDGNTISESSPTIDLIVPVYASYHPAESFAIYGTPKYNLSLFDGNTSHRAGGSVGFKLGKSFGLMGEATWMQDLTNDIPLSQINGAIFTNF